MKKTKIWMLALSMIGLFFGGCLSIDAEGGEEITMPHAYGEIAHAIPDDVRDNLPDDFFSSDPHVAMSAVETVASPTYILQVIWRMLGIHMGDILGLFATWLGLLLLSTVWRQMGERYLSGQNRAGVQFCLRLCMYTIIITRATQTLTWVTGYLEDVGGLMQGMLPLMGVLYAMGGNLGQATVSFEITLLMLHFCEYLATTILPPLCGVALAFALIDAMGGHIALKFAPISGLCKKWYASILGFLTFLLTGTLALQSILTAKADTWGMRSIKYAIGQMLPVVGGGVAGVLGFVASGVGMLRGVAGVSGVVLLILLLLPTLIKLWLMKGCYQVASSVAGLLSCDGEARLLSEIGSLYGYMMATVGIVSVAFAVSLGIFAWGSVALVGG